MIFTDLEITYNGKVYNVEFEAEYTRYFHDKGRYSGAWEDCYPEYIEIEFEVLPETIQTLDDDDNVVFMPEMAETIAIDLSDYIEERLIQQAIEDSYERYCEIEEDKRIDRLERDYWLDKN